MPSGPDGDPPIPAFDHPRGFEEPVRKTGLRYVGLTEDAIMVNSIHAT
jgi:hypothetical protein